MRQPAGPGRASPSAGPVQRRGHRRPDLAGRPYERVAAGRAGLGRAVVDRAVLHSAAGVACRGSGHRRGLSRPVRVRARPGGRQRPGHGRNAGHAAALRSAVGGCVGRRITSRVGYASLVFYDDVDRDGTLGLSRRTRRRAAGTTARMNGCRGLAGHRLRRELRDDDRARSAGRVPAGHVRSGSAFYPRNGCPGQPNGSRCSAGGFSAAAGLAASAAGMLPAEDPASCSTNPPDTLMSVVRGLRTKSKESTARNEHSTGRLDTASHPPTRPTSQVGDRLRAPARIRRGNAAQADSARRIGPDHRPLQGTDPLHAARMPRRRVLRASGLGLHSQSARLVAVPN